MNKNLNLIISLWALLLTFSACSDSTVLMKSTTGKAGEMVVIMPRELWSGAAGDTVMHFMAQPQLGLPQVEPIFNVNNVPPDAFKAFETTRNLLMTKISQDVKEPSVKVQSSVFAKDQLIVTVQARDVEQFVQFFTEKSDYIIAAFLQAEKRRLMDMYANNRYRNEPIREKLEKKFNIGLNIPKGYDWAKDTTDFAWITYESQLTSQGILVYSFPYNSDSTFTTSYLLQKRDSIVKLHVPGPLPGSYMTTEHQVPVLAQPFRLKGNYTVEIRGLWRVEGDFMGGPFVSLASLDLSAKRVVVAEGFLYSPKYEYRNYLRQLEAMIYSLTFVNQPFNDKLNQQFNLGEPVTDSSDSTKAE